MPPFCTKQYSPPSTQLPLTQLCSLLLKLIASPGTCWEAAAWGRAWELHESLTSSSPARMYWHIQEEKNALLQGGAVSPAGGKIRAYAGLHIPIAPGAGPSPGPPVPSNTEGSLRVPLTTQHRSRAATVVTPRWAPMCIHQDTSTRTYTHRPHSALTIASPSPGSAPRCSPQPPHLHLVRRFWNQVFTCASVILRALARAARSAEARYFCRWKRFSSSQICRRVKDVRGFFFLGGVRFW